LFRTDNPSPTLIFITESGAHFTGTLADISSGKLPTSTSVVAGAPLTCSMDTVRIIAPPKSLAAGIEELIDKYYRRLVRAFNYAGILATLVLLIRFRKAGLGRPIYGVLLLLAVAVASRFGLFVFLDATSWPAAEPRYLFPVMPLFTCFLILLIGQSVQVASKTMAALSPAAER
jgi:hypothetical protein